MASFKDFLLTDLYTGLVSQWTALKNRTLFFANNEADTELSDGMVMFRNNRLEQYSASTSTWSEYIPKATAKYDINVDQLDGYDADHFASAADLATKEPATPSGSSSQYWRGDKTWADLGSAARSALSNIFLPFSGGKMTGLLELFAGSTAPTAAQFDSSGNIATTWFVHRASGNLRGAYWFANESTFTVDQIGGLCFPAVAGAKAYLPGIATLPAGASYLIFNHTASAITIQAQTGQSVLMGNGIAGDGQSFTVRAGSWVKVIKYAEGFWLAIGSGAQYTYAGNSTATGVTYIDFAVPTYAKKIKIVFAGTTTTDSSLLIAKLGYAGGIMTSGYMSNAADIGNGAYGLYQTSAGIALATGPSWTATGVLELTKTGTTWIASGGFIRAGTTINGNTAGYLTNDNTAATTTVRVTTEGGTATFTASNINVIWE